VSTASPVSPCIGVCTLDPATSLCRGCLRSIEEIAGWPRFDAEERRRVLAQLPARQAGRDAAAPQVS
jgi:uncharacterized protein